MCWYKKSPHALVCPPQMFPECQRLILRNNILLQTTPGTRWVWFSSLCHISSMWTQFVDSGLPCPPELGGLPAANPFTDSLWLYPWPLNCRVNIYLALFRCLRKRLTATTHLAFWFYFFVRFSSFTERMLAAQLLYMYILKKGLTSGRTKPAFRLDSRRRHSWLFSALF